MTTKLGASGRIAALFQSARITPLLALVALLLGAFAVVVTPREEEPQIDNTMANVLIPFPGASVEDVEQIVSAPAEQVLSQMAGVEHVASVSRPGLAIVTVQFEIGVPRTEALVRLYDTVSSNADWLPAELGVLDPIVKPKGIDDLPIVSLALYSRAEQVGPYDLERVAHSIEADLKRVPGTREVTAIGGPGRAVMIEIDPARMNGNGITVDDVRGTLRSANSGLPVGDLVAGNRIVAVEAGPFLRDAREAAPHAEAIRAQVLAAKVHSTEYEVAASDFVAIGACVELLPDRVRLAAWAGNLDEDVLHTVNRTLDKRPWPSLDTHQILDFGAYA